MIAGEPDCQERRRCAPFGIAEILGPPDKPGDDELWGVGLSAVYIMASRKHGTLYVGVTSELLNRATQHREGVMDGFTKQYGVKRLVWYEWHDSIEAAIHREKRLKKYKREWKINLIERDNPDWDDLFPQFFIEDGPLARLQPHERSL
jgi:putative endonuclease